MNNYVEDTPMLMSHTSVEPRLVRGFSFVLIEDDEIPKKQEQMIQDVIELLCISDTIARSLLLKFNWNKN